MKLTAAGIRAAQPRDRAYKIADGGGLFLHVASTGTRTMRMSFRYRGKEQLLVFGRVPEISLAQARELRDDARRQLRQGVNPAGARQRTIEAAAAANTDDGTFEQLARAWHAEQLGGWSTVHAADVIESLERDVFPTIGALQICMIKTPIVLAAIRAIEARGALETAKRVQTRIVAVFDFAIGEGLLETNPAVPTKKALKAARPKRRQPALTDPDQARAVLVSAEASSAPAIVKLASRFLALTSVRAAVVRGAIWEEFEGIDWEDRVSSPSSPLWRIPAARMKLSVGKKALADFDHLVPLSRQAVDVLRAARSLAGAGVSAGELAFPAAAGKPIGKNTIGAMYNEAGFAGRHVPHGWRATFSTTMKALARARKCQEDLDTIELMLAHQLANDVAAAYDRDQQIERRRAIGQEWADIIAQGLLLAAELLPH
jgi:integrase